MYEVATQQSGEMVSRNTQTEMMISRQAQEVQGAMVIAKRFPRDEVESFNRIMQSCKRKSLAESAMYEYPRGGTKVSGPSIRLAEAMAQNWGNIDFGITELEQKNGESQVMAYAWDLETNTRQVKIFSVPHVRGTKKGNVPLTDPRDVYEMVANQGARRLRSCILGIIPGDVVEAAVKQCEDTLINGEKWLNINPGPVTYPGMNRMDFGYYRNPIKNKVDGSACGVSVYDSATDLIKKADIQGARLDWEYESGERAIHVDGKALKQDKSTGRFGMARLNKRLYRGLNLEAGKDQELLKEYSPEMRDEAFKRGLEEYKREIEFSVGLAYGDLSDVQEVAKTATEIKVSKNRKYNRVTAIQNNLYDCLEDFAAGLAFYNSMLNSGYEFSCKFNDSILTDEETERKQDMADVAAGFMHHWEYRMKWYGEDEETAKANVPEQNQVME